MRIRFENQWVGILNKRYNKYFQLIELSYQAYDDLDDIVRKRVVIVLFGLVFLIDF